MPSTASCRSSGNAGSACGRATVRASTVLDLFTRECLAMTQVLEFFGGDDWDVLECHDFAAIGLIAERMA